ncbi:transcriptional regulator, partial [Burkholderia cenocepacia]
MLLSSLVAQSNPALLQPPATALRLRLQPDGLSSQRAYCHQPRAHILPRLHPQIAARCDRTLQALLDQHPALRSAAGHLDVSSTPAASANLAL